MDGTWILAIASVFLLVALGLILRNKTPGLQPRTSQHAAPLGEMIKSAEIANQAFFRSLELVQKNLESLISRAESMEERLRMLVLHPGIEKREQYTAAALLLAEGQDPERVASMLSLPVQQVQLIRDLQQVSTKDKRGVVRNGRVEEVSPLESGRQSKSSARGEKSAPRPILLVDAIRSVAGDAQAQGTLGRLESASA
ncbi:MAG TPA: hypothetical protein VIB79_07380 [Candidatus Binatia bacterium]|jgi:hypothetical protein